MGTVKQIDIKNRTYYFYNNIIYLESFKSHLLKIDCDCENIYSENPLYLCITHANRYIEEKGVNKYLIFDPIDENTVLLKKYNVFNRIMGKIKEVSSDECDYEKGYMKIKFNSDDNVPLNKPLKFHNMTITIRSVFKEDSKLHPQVFLDDTLNELHI